jgi:cell division protein YceG involved in septum cleavage
VNYLYFVAESESRHHFSATMAEHNAAVARYRSGRLR